MVPRTDLWIAAEDTAEDGDTLAMLLEEETADGGAAGAAGAAAGVAGAAGASAEAGAASATEAVACAAGDDLGQVFAAVCEDVTAKATAAIGLDPTAKGSVAGTDVLRRWAASHCRAGAPQHRPAALAAPPPPPRPALPAPPPRPRRPPAGWAASSSFWSWGEAAWQSEGWDGRWRQCD